MPTGAVRSSGPRLEDVAGITVDSPTQLTITTSRPWVAFPWFLYLGGRLVIVAPAQLANPETCPRNLIGTGPFQFDHWTVNQELVVTRNPHYWQHDAQGRRLPYLDRITFRPVTEGVQRVNGLEAGQLDVIHTADGQQVDVLVGHPKFNLVREQPGRGAVRYYLMNTAEPPLDDIRARRAIALAIDRHQINELRNGGIFEVADGPFDRSVAGYMKDPGYPHYSPKESARLVEAYKAEHDGGFHVVLAHTDDPADAAEAQLVKVQLGHVGIDATLQQLDQTAFILTAVAGNFSILLWRNHPGEDPDINYQWWSSDSRLNFGRIDDPKLQQLLDQGRGENRPRQTQANLRARQRGVLGPAVQRMGLPPRVGRRSEQTCARPHRRTAA